MADKAEQNKMDDNVVLPVICDSVVNCDEEMERFLRNGSDFDFVAIAGVSCCFVRRNLTRIQNYFESTVSNYFADEFAAQFRMTQTTVELLAREVIHTGRIPLGNPFGRPSIPPEKQVLVFLWALATQEGTREIADRFDITYSSVSRTVALVMNAVCGLKNQCIRWPNGNEINEVRADFGATFPGVIGVIDGTLIHIRCPSENNEAYNCRKRFYALNVQVAHGPYRDNGHLARQQSRCNEALSSQRQVIERAIGLLKGRWRKLQYLNLLSVKLMTIFIMAACVLHNFCLINDDFDEGYFLCDDDDDGDNDIKVDHSLGSVCRQAEQRRTHITNLL